MLTKQQIKHIRQLQQKKYRDRNQLFLAEGVKLVDEALISQVDQIEQIVYTTGTITKLKNRHLIPSDLAEEIHSKEFQQCSSLKNPQGILAVLRQTEAPTPEVSEITDLSLVLDSVRDPGNLGTILRIADWFGIEHIICSEDTVEQYNPKVVQATMGAIFRVKIHYTNLEHFLKSAIEHGTHKIYGTTLDGENMYKTNIQLPALLVLGNESLGISESLIKFIPENLLIPSFSHKGQGSESLNVSMAAAISCSEIRRQNS